jgi:tetratricopeptide (TPR) repeat protein
MAEKQVITAQNDAADIVEKAKGFWAQYSKKIIIVGSVIIAVLGGYLGYKYLVAIPNEKKANDLIFPAEKLFGLVAGSSSYNKDTVNMILNGDKAAGVTGLLKIAGSYGGTKSGNRAQYMIGACYLNLKQFDKAITHLKDFDGNGASQIQSKAYVLLGHAYAEQKKTDDALDYYKKAASALTDEDATQKVVTLFMAAQYADYLGKTKEAIDILQDMKNNHMAGMLKKDPSNFQEPPPPVTVDDVDKYLAKLGATK